MLGPARRAQPAWWRGCSGASPLRIMLIDGEGRLLASSLAQDAGRAGQAIEADVVVRALAGQDAWEIRYSRMLGEEVVDVAVPVVQNGKVVGAVRLSHSMDEIMERLRSLRWFVFGTFATGLIAAALLGWFLARSMTAPLMNLARAVGQFKLGEDPTLVHPAGSREMNLLIARYNEMAHHLHQSEVERQRLLAGIVHEVSRPLGAVNSAAQLLVRRENLDMELVRELAGEIEEHIYEVSRQVNDLALLAQSELGGIPLNRQVIRLTDVYDQNFRHMAARMQRGGITLESDLPPEMPPVCADAARVAQILDNLLDNARKYTPAGGTVSVTARVEKLPGQKAMAALSVRDTGPGILAEEHGRVFEYFYRSPQTRPVHVGMGIGLALSRESARAHGGTLTLESEPGRGSTFTLRLPLAEADCGAGATSL